MMDARTNPGMTTASKPLARTPSRETSMVVLNRIYTRTGDEGTTALGTGERRKKYDLRVSAYGTLDELASVLGLVRLHTGADAALDAALARVQNDLFDVEADLCMPGEAGKGPGGARLTVTDVQVEWIEGEIDRLNDKLAPLRSFILPGGTPLAAHLHLARTVCRRAERLMVELADQPSEEVSRAGLKYVNRLSDFFFVAARHANDDGARDVLWQPGQNR
jgi:cob(I)alamin adenosyltransferase